MVAIFEIRVERFRNRSPIETPVTVEVLKLPLEGLKRLAVEGLQGRHGRRLFLSIFSLFLSLHPYDDQPLLVQLLVLPTAGYVSTCYLFLIATCYLLTTYLLPLISTPSIWKILT